jgi:hypothetical protein
MRADEACAPGDQGPAGFAVHGRERIEAVGALGVWSGAPPVRRTARSATSASLVCGDPVGGLSARSLLGCRFTSEQECGLPPDRRRKNLPTSRPGSFSSAGSSVDDTDPAAHTNSCGRGGAPPPGAAASLT